MWIPDYFVRYLKLPATVKGITVPNNDGTFDIYINSVLCEEKQQECLRHEIRHIVQDHFYNETVPIDEIERLADALVVGPHRGTDKAVIHPKVL